MVSVMTIDEMFAQAIADGRAGELDQAEAMYRRILAASPAHPQAWFNLGNVLRRAGRIDEAIAAYRQALAARGNFPEALSNLALTLRSRGEGEEAIGLLRRLTELLPNSADAWRELGHALATVGRLDEAVAAFQQVLALRTDRADDWNNLGVILAAKGPADEAAMCYEQSLSIRPDRAVHSSRLVLLWFCADQDSGSLLREHREWNDRYARPLAGSIRPHDNDRNPDRRLRVGYVSRELSRTIVGSNLLPMLRHRDREQFEVYCYSGGDGRDEMADRIAAAADVWRDIHRLGDEEAAERVRADRIDILVDLGMHTFGNRLLMFARKPAPVQVTYLSYCATTGVDAIDYRLSDPYFDPPDGPHRSDLSDYSERTVRLPHAYWAYEPGGPMPDVGPLPAVAAGCVTFGSMTDFRKVSEPALDLWAQVMRAAPGSRLLLYAPLLSHRPKVLDRFIAAGVEPDRVEFVGRQAWPQYVETFHRIDMVLDTLPYTGGIASCDTLMMGAPVVTLRGGTSVGRGGCSILSNIGLPELIADTPDDYVRIAVGLAGDLPRLAELRAGLRRRMEQSPLMDAKGFARGIEAAYRQMWHTWCRG
jgi:protein O-GlcNAc transferase